jgi:8-oxo-dGTP pyrophosphatase MutT (NUDIX family)
MEAKKIIAGGGLVFNETGALLMIYRRSKWDLPKGKLDEGETIETCALREVKEETGLITVIRGSLIDIGYHHYFDLHLNEQVIKETHWYRMFASADQPLTPQTTEDITDIRWVKDAELEACLSNSYPNIVETIKKAL